MKNASHVFFDLDGTLSDSREGITKSMRYALQQVGVTAPSLQELEQYIGPPAHQTFEGMMSADKVDQALAAYRERYDAQGYGITENRLYDGIVETLTALRDAGKHMMVVTAKPHPISKRIVAHFGIDSFFEAVFGPEPGQKIADKSGLVAAALKQAHIDPQQAVMVGDRSHDVHGAGKNNVRCIGAGWGFGTKGELTQAGAVAIAQKPTDLLALLV